MTESSSLNLTIKRKSNKKAGFEVEQQEDGFYYISKVPKNCKKIGVGDRVLEINGTMHSDFKSAANANDLVDSFRLEVVPIDDDDEDEDESDEEYEEMDRSGSKSRRIPVTDPIESEEVDDSARSAEEVDDSARSAEEVDDSARSAEEVDDSARSAEEVDDSARSAEEVDDSDRSAEEVDDSDGSENDESHGEVDEDDSDYGEDSNDGEEVENEESDWDEEGVDEEGVANNTSSSSGGMNEIKRGVAPSKSWERPYVSQYKAQDRFMISVTKEEDDDDLGINLIEYQENEIYVSEVNDGPFYETALNRGDKIISVNGKKVSNHLHSVDEIMDLINSLKSKIQIFVLRPSPDDVGYNWVHEYMSSHFSDHQLNYKP